MRCSVLSFQLLASSILVAQLGCGGDARVELAAGDALGAIAEQLETTVNEYHTEVSAGDDGREAAVAAAFVDRVLSAGDDRTQIQTHTQEFLAALTKIRKDREVEWDRRNAARDNLRLLREVGRDLQKLAVQSMTLNDELRRYLTGWVETYQRTRREAQEARRQERAERKQAAAQAAGQIVGAIESRIPRAAPRGQ